MDLDYILLFISWLVSNFLLLNVNFVMFLFKTLYVSLHFTRILCSVHKETYVLSYSLQYSRAHLWVHKKNIENSY